jgi:ribose-phosphate pyrophosphokinase
MRQDTQFHPGEAVTSKEFAALLSNYVDWIATLDPHLHRYQSLSEIYSVPAIAGSATDEIARWIGANVERPVIIGPDEESRQWVGRIAVGAGARSAVLRKTRSGDYSVKIDDGGLEHLGAGTPVLVDDIASSAHTLIEAVGLVRRHASKPPVCAVVHAIFAGDSYRQLMESGVAGIVSTNTVIHESNAIDISGPLAAAVNSVSPAS